MAGRFVPFFSQVQVVESSKGDFSDFNSIMVSYARQNSYAFSECSDCESGLRCQSREKLNSACQGSTVLCVPCAYPCSNLSYITTAEATTSILKKELSSTLYSLLFL